MQELFERFLVLLEGAEPRGSAAQDAEEIHAGKAGPPGVAAEVFRAWKEVIEKQLQPIAPTVELAPVVAKDIDSSETAAHVGRRWLGQLVHGEPRPNRFRHRAAECPGREV